MSASLKKALQTIDTVEVTHSGQFAYLMWPDSPAWKKSARCGPNGIAQGVGIKLAGGGYLGKLQKRGLIVQGTKWRLTKEGQRKLKELTQP